MRESNIVSDLQQCETCKSNVFFPKHDVPWRRSLSWVSICGESGSIKGDNLPRFPGFSAKMTERPMRKSIVFQYLPFQSIFTMLRAGWEWDLYGNGRVRFSHFPLHARLNPLSRTANLPASHSSHAIHMTSLFHPLCLSSGA